MESSWTANLVIDHHPQKYNPSKAISTLRAFPELCFKRTLKRNSVTWSHAKCSFSSVLWSLLGPLGTERTEWFRRASSELAHMAGEKLWSDHVFNSFHQFLWDLPRALLQSNLQGGPAWREVHRSVRMLGKHICLVEKVLERINVALYTVLFASYAMSA